MNRPLPTALVIGASREAGQLRELLRNRGWPDIDANGAELAQACIVAPHPFDRELLGFGLTLARRHGLPVVALLRPGWMAQDGDDWHRVPNAVDAAQMVRRRGWQRIFLAIGQQRQGAFETITGCRLFIRRQGAKTTAEGRHEILGATGPFTVEGERKLLQYLKIDAMVAHDAGGSGGWPKMAAARMQSLPVVLIERPAPPDARIVETPAAALDWLSNLDL